MSHTNLEQVRPTVTSFYRNSESGTATRSLVFFVTGNPGLISYYDAFLTTLYHLLSAKYKQSSVEIDVVGQSLAGFEEDNGPVTSTPYSLEQQIQILLHSLNGQQILSGSRRGEQYDQIILIGHSVGSYICLELIRRLKESSSHLNIKAAILLFPTVTHISQSPSGVKITKLFQIPNFPQKAGIAAKALVSIFPQEWLKRLVGIVTGMPAASAEVTTRFLKSRMGVWQALHMAKNEMETITEDRWDEDIWGIEHEDVDQKEKAPKLVFYFGQNDHWVADHTRDALIAARGSSHIDSKSSKPMMLIDQDGIPHGFCIKHSETIAEKVKVWIEEILDD